MCIIGRYLFAFVLLLAAAPAWAGGRIALSFDDGPNARLTPQLLDILQGAGITATFCLIGQHVVQMPAVVRRMHAAGHQLCNHSWSHSVLTSHNVGWQITKTDAAIRAATGITPRILRAPYGETKFVGPCHQGRSFVGWDIDTLDWRYRSPLRIMRAAVGARVGGVVLMHDIHATTVAAVPGIIAGLKAHGTTFVHASELWHKPCSGR